MTITNTFCKLASLRPADTNEVQLYVVPSSTEVIAILRICNQDSVARTYRVAHTTAGHGDTAADGDDFIIYDKTISPYDTHEVSISANATETIRVKASEADKLSFVLSGMKKVIT